MKISVTAALAITTLSASAAISFDLTGTTTTDGWDQLLGSRLSGYGNHPGSDPWTTSIASNTAGSDNTATFGKTSGGGYLGGASFYDGGSVGVLNLTSTSTINNLANLIFQIDMGTSTFTSAPQLLINGTTLLSADLAAVYTGDHSFSFGGPPQLTENHVFQWDLSNVADPITSYEVQWETSPHTTIFEMQLDTSDTFIEVIPEPSTGLLTFLASGLLMTRRKRLR